MLYASPSQELGLQLEEDERSEVWALESLIHRPNLGVFVGKFVG